MLKTELLELLANGKNSGVEFKRDDIRPEQLAIEIVAMANFQGGRVILGVGDDGSIHGLQRENTEEWVMNVIRDRIHPLVHPYSEEIKIEEAVFVAVITFPQGVSKPYGLRSFGEENIFIRVGSTSQLATREPQMQLFEVDGMLHTEVLPVSGTNSCCLDKARLENYLRDIIQDPDCPKTDEDWEKRLTGMGFLVEPKGYCTVAGLVLFGKNPRKYLRQAGLRVLIFDSKDKESQPQLDLILDGPLVGRWDFAGSGNKLFDDGIVENFLDRILPFITKAPDEKLRGKTGWLYPLDAIREVIINAFAHRDWTRLIEIKAGIYSDRIEIISPGKLQNSMTVEKMISGPRCFRNTIIRETLHDYRFVDFRGMGIRTKVILPMKKNNNVEPVFEATEDYLKTVLYKKT